LPLIVLLFITRIPGWALMTPPPLPRAALPITVLSVTVKLPLLEMPPPLRLALLSLTTILVRFTVSLLPILIAPPLALGPGSPWVIVRSFRLRVVTLLAVVAISNTRSLKPASMIVLAAPAPLIVNGALVVQPTLRQVTSRSPVSAVSSLLLPPIE
jgi:hypothetical protein